MIEFNTTTNTPRKIIIPVSSEKEVLRYQQGLLGILSTIELKSIGPVLREDVKAVYNLLNHIQCADKPEQLLEAGRTRMLKQ